MLTTVAFITLALVAVALVVLALLYRRASGNGSTLLESRLETFEKAQERTERVVKEEIALSRGEQGKSASDQRQELSVAFKTFGDSVGQRMNDLAKPASIGSG
jgi:DNA recombination protein RmuC